MNLLNLYSKYGKFTIKDLRCQLEKEHKVPSFVNISPYEPVLDAVFKYELSEHDSDVLVFISGYVARSVSGKLKCKMCSNRLFTVKELTSL